jgi:hypothetical protein
MKRGFALTPVCGELRLFSREAIALKTLSMSVIADF